MTDFSLTEALGGGGASASIGEYKLFSPDKPGFFIDNLGQHWLKTGLLSVDTANYPDMPATVVSTEDDSFSYTATVAGTHSLLFSAQSYYGLRADIKNNRFIALNDHSSYNGHRYAMQNLDDNSSVSNNQVAYVLIPDNDNNVEEAKGICYAYDGTKAFVIELYNNTTLKINSYSVDVSNANHAYRGKLVAQLDQATIETVASPYTTNGTYNTSNVRMHHDVDNDLLFVLFTNKLVIFTTTDANGFYVDGTMDNTVAPTTVIDYSADFTNGYLTVSPTDLYIFGSSSQLDNNINGSYNARVIPRSGDLSWASGSWLVPSTSESALDAAKRVAGDFLTGIYMTKYFIYIDTDAGEPRFFCTTGTSSSYSSSREPRLMNRTSIFGEPTGKSYSSVPYYVRIK